MKELLGFRVGSDEDLEAAVKKKAVDDVGSDTAADGVRSFEEEEGDVVGVEVGGSGKTRKAGSNDDDTRGFWLRWYWLERRREC